jgi:hypothetical protein
MPQVRVLCCTGLCMCTCNLPPHICTPACMHAYMLSMHTAVAITAAALVRHLLLALVNDVLRRCWCPGAIDCCQRQGHICSTWPTQQQQR